MPAAPGAAQAWDWVPAVRATTADATKVEPGFFVQTSQPAHKMQERAFFGLVLSFPVQPKCWWVANASVATLCKNPGDFCFGGVAY